MEILDIVDKEGRPTGQTIERNEAHRIGAWHRCASVWIIRQKAGKWQVLLQKRSANKDSYPGCFDTSSAGHIAAGDEPLATIIRELEEELGIKSQAADFTFIGTFHNCYDEVFHQTEFKNREVSFVHVYSKPVDENKLVLQKEEVSAIAWFDLDEVWEKAQAKDPDFCTPVGGLKLLREYLQKL
ncbi:NUDIX domain-containing protein [Lactobacillus delbrueckii subsp. bulgaricus]|uniref:NUDIX hydrolase n=1 Tax=Lactobacillus delbrueckii TaxID=1584 RepID=UPI001593BC73|nr:NUDIX domain-containing protein [Lactobacillus delbrueckii]NVH29726.1 NUDIX domain-containing protein [Lactobacillus delbrueckii subsp. bulgaricus]NWO31555.1 NUDIX domain-containing protein [Lactobacillus delbrueckii subsp. bulgaricus]